MARPRKNEGTPAPQDSPPEKTEEQSEEPVSEQTADEAPVEPEEAAPPEDAEEAPAEQAPEATPAAETPAAPVETVKPKRVRRPKEERRARTQTRKVRRAKRSDGTRKPIVRLPKPEHARGRRKERRGVVVSSAMEKTIVVRVDTARPHRRYKKVVRMSRKIHAHDEQNEANVGDVVRIVETRPVSKTKHWRLAEVVEQAR